MYRGLGTFKGTKCAVGCLILDEFYDPNMEGKLVYEFIVRNALERSLRTSLNESDLIFFKQLQAIHDKTDISRWSQRLASFAESQELKFNPPQV